MLNAVDRAKLINTLKHAMLILAVPWAAFAAAKYAAFLVLDLTGYKALYPGFVGLLLCVVCYAAFSALFLGFGMFLLRIRRNRFLSLLGLMMLLLPVVYFAALWYDCCC